LRESSVGLEVLKSEIALVTRSVGYSIQKYRHIISSLMMDIYLFFAYSDRKYASLHNRNISFIKQFRYQKLKRNIFFINCFNCNGKKIPIKLEKIMEKHRFFHIA